MEERPIGPSPVRSLPFNLQAGETEALALAVELAGVLLLVDDAQGRRAAQALGIDYTGTVGILLRANAESKCVLPRPARVLSSMPCRRGHRSGMVGQCRGAFGKAEQRNATKARSDRWIRIKSGTRPETHVVFQDKRGDGRGVADSSPSRGDYVPGPRGSVGYFAAQ
jgi:hypothetical protein